VILRYFLKKIILITKIQIFLYYLNLIKKIKIVNKKAKHKIMIIKMLLTKDCLIIYNNSLNILKIILVEYKKLFSKICNPKFSSNVKYFLYWLSDVFRFLWEKISWKK